MSTRTRNLKLDHLITQLFDEVIKTVTDIIKAPKGRSPSGAAVLDAIQDIKNFAATKRKHSA